MLLNHPREPYMFANRMIFVSNMYLVYTFSYATNLGIETQMQILRDERKDYTQT